ncbi:MAG: GGDEF domain-containing protein [Desulfobacteraceae bacterium]|nr:GGDEF domain-containing protein [Desulfobacteraceae bacterium]
MDNAKKAQEFAKASIEAIRTIASKKMEMNIENLSRELLSKKFLFDSGSYEDYKNSKSFAELQEKYARLENQKNQFFRDYEELSDKREKEREVFKKALLFFTDFAKSSASESSREYIERFRKFIKKDSGTDVFENELSSLKNNILKSDIEENLREEDKKSFFKKLKFSQAKGLDEGERGEYIELLRETYKDIIEKLNLAVGSVCVEDLSDLGSKISQLSSADDFFMARSKILDILKVYLKSVDDDREEAAKFIKEIGQRLLEVEDQLLKSYIDDSEHIEGANSSFTSILENHLNDLNKNVSMSQSLEEVKNAVVSKLNTIKIVIHRKNTEDKKHQEEVKKKFSEMQQKLMIFKKEMENAEQNIKKMEKDLLLDPLTGAYNRRAYDKRVKEEIERFFRYKTKFSMILFDVDHFKNINDSYGHDIGDKCLTEIIKRVGPLLRLSDFLARYGGEEFAVLLPETNQEGAFNVAEKIRKTIEEISFVYKKEKITITVSLGVCEIKEGDSGYDSLFSRLDKAMYEAKNSGRNKVVAGK